MNPLIAFIKNQQQLGVTREVITTQLMSQGWTKADVDQAFASLSVSSSAVPPPMSSVTPNQNFVQPNLPQQHKSKLPLFVSVIIILCLIGGGVFAYYKFVNPATSSQDILKKSFEASRSVKSFSFVATSTGQANNQLGNGVPSSSDFTLTVSGSVDFHVPEAPLFDVNLGINAGFTDAANPGSFSLGLESIYVDKNLYLALKNFKVSTASSGPNAAQVQMFNGIATSLQNKWIQFNITKSVNTESQPPLSPQAKADEIMIRDYISGMSYISALRTIGTETIDNISMHHIRMTIQGDQKLIDIIKKLSSENTSRALTNGQLEDVSKIVNQKVDLDVWIGKDDFLVYKIVSSSINISGAQAKTQGTLTQEIFLSNYNEPLSVIAPEGAVPFETIMKNLFGNMFGGATTLPPSKK